MKILKFISVTIIIFAIISLIPILMYENINENDYYTQNKTNSLSGPMKYLKQILNSDEINSSETKQDILALSDEYSNIIKGYKKDFITLFMITTLILTSLIIILGVIILKYTSLKSFSYSIIIAGILSIFAYLYIYIDVISGLSKMI